MPVCSVVVCNKSSRHVNYAKDGISFYAFPTDPYLKEKWMNATGRKSDWFPTKNSRICSVHFEPKYFQPSGKIRRLFDSAVPTLRLRVAYCIEPSSSKDSDSDRLELDIKQEPKEEMTDDDPLFLPSSRVTVDPPMETQSHNPITEENEINETSRKKLREYILRQKLLIKTQKIKIKTLQKRCSRYQKRIAALKDVILENKSVVPPIMVNKTQQVNFMYSIPKPTNVSAGNVTTKN